MKEPIYAGLAPLKFVVSAVSGIVTVGIITRQGGAQQLDRWALVATVSSFSGLAELGLGRALQYSRSVDSSGLFGGLRRFAHQVYGASAALLALGGIFVLSHSTSATTAVDVGWVLSCLGLALALVARLRWLLLIVEGRLWWAWSAETLAPLVLGTVAIVGALIGHPEVFQGLAVALSGAASLAITSLGSRRLGAAGSDRSRVTSHRSIFRAARPFMAAGVLDASNEPMYRMLVVLIVGASGIAAYIVALRPALALLQVISCPFVLIFARSVRSSGESKIPMLPFAIACVAFGLGAELILGPFMRIWVPDMADEVLPSARLLILWGVLQLLGGPSFERMQGAGRQLMLRRILMLQYVVGIAGGVLIHLLGRHSLLAVSMVILFSGSVNTVAILASEFVWTRSRRALGHKQAAATAYSV